MEDHEKTRLIRRSMAQPPTPPHPESTPQPEDDLEKTRILSRRTTDSEEPQENLMQAEEDKTVILRPSSRNREAGEIPANDPMADPLVGWLVVIAGPGQGNFARLGHGMNSIGRAEGQRCRLDFGDTEISRKVHATITYDPRGRKFYLMHGGGQNLTYLGETPVLQPALLTGGELISLGKTSLKFIPLCGPDFDWSQQQG
ncbi:MAG: FHA domain-containing protein [Verrucomicrobia bacterium]|nr:FHA domain-containing protein [Verrucomicrobiota bacterium]